MQQRRLRLGDILDDYCPRERRITNHAVVAMIDDQVKQTRCTTCDADHDYKQARVPAPRRKKDGVLAGDPAEAGRPHAAAPDSDMDDDELIPDDMDVDAPDDAPIEAAAAAEPVEGEPAIDGDAADEDGSPGNEAGNDARGDEGPVHRRLIRATLPRQEGQVPERKMPEFTVRQPGGRGREFDANRNATGGGGGGMGGGGGQRHGRGRRAMRGPQQPGQSTGQPPRFGSGGPRQGSPQGQRDGNRPNPPGGGQRGGGGRPQGQARGPGRKRGPR
jgi:hypothetical protein